MPIVPMTTLSLALALSILFSTGSDVRAETESLSVKGEVLTELSLSREDLLKMPMFRIKFVAQVAQKKSKDDPERLLDIADYEGVLLRDILDRAGMKHTRKWEPGVFFRVRGVTGEEVVFSFGEIFYSSIGRSALLALKKDAKPIPNPKGVGLLVVSTDTRAGRSLHGVKEIVVQRVGVELKAYEDRRRGVVRPPTSSFTLIDRSGEKTMTVTPEILQSLPNVVIPDALRVGDCEGFKGISSFEGPTLRTLLERFGIGFVDHRYNRFVTVYSDDGFAATFSFGEIFNSRLSDNAIIAHKKNGKILDAEDGFAMTAVREDSTGGRSVKRIKAIEVLP